MVFVKIDNNFYDVDKKVFETCIESLNKGQIIAHPEDTWEILKKYMIKTAVPMKKLAEKLGYVDFDQIEQKYANKNLDNIDHIIVDDYFKKCI
jgi:hypothetical protein